VIRYNGEQLFNFNFQVTLSCRTVCHTHSHWLKVELILIQTQGETERLTLKHSVSEWLSQPVSELLSIVELSIDYHDEWQIKK